MASDTAKTIPQSTRSSRLPRKVAVVLNRQAGQLLKEEGLERTVSALEEKLVKPDFDASITLADGETIKDAITAAMESDVDIVCVGGGDGTLRTAIRCALKHDKALFILPMGTYNLLARDLGIPSDVPKAVELFSTGKIARIDVGEVNGEVFACQTIIGFYPQLAQAKERMRGQSPFVKWLKLSAQATHVLRHNPLMEIETSSEHGKQVFTTRMVIVSNNRLEHSDVGELPRREELDEHILGLYIHNQDSRLRLAWSSAAMILGLWESDPNLVRNVCSELRIAPKGKDRLRVSIDGEIKWIKAPLRYKVRPAALSVVVA